MRNIVINDMNERLTRMTPHDSFDGIGGSIVRRHSLPEILHRLRKYKILILIARRRREGGLSMLFTLKDILIREVTARSPWLAAT